jgi:hypothetical protein
MVYRVIHLRKEVKTVQLGVTIEAPQVEFIEEFEAEADWSARIEELRNLGFTIHIKGETAYALKPGVYRKI